MLITFKSIIDQGLKNKEEIKFTSSLTKSKYNNFNVLEFKEPQDNIQNRIEYNDSEVIIFTGPNTMNLKLNEDLLMNYELPNGIVQFTSHMHELNISDNKINFSYDLHHQGKKLGNYKINIEIKE